MTTTMNMTTLATRRVGAGMRSVQMQSSVRAHSAVAATAAAMAGVRTVPWTLPWTLRTPQLRDVQQAKVVLPNGLSAVVVSDPKAPTTGAAVSIEAGSWMDGEHAGSAHFLEHMLFLGSAKYPDEAEFERFVLDAGGTFNGYTASDHSLYYFSGVTPASLDGALDRLSRFLYEPRLSASCVARERRAVDEEHRRNITADAWRALQVKKEIADQRHPFALFSTGNLETMERIDREYLRAWHERHYCAGRMHAVVHGNQPVDALTDLAIRAFGPVLNRGAPPLSTAGSRIFPAHLGGCAVWIAPVKDLKEISLSWEIDPRFARLDSKPAQLVAHVLGHEGSGSLLSMLRTEGLAVGLAAGDHIVGADNVAFEISVTLTDKGVAQWRSVIARIYDAIRTLRDLGPFPPHIVDESRFMSKIAYEFQQRSTGIATSLCGALRREGIDSFPNRTYMIEKFDPDAVRELLGLLSPETATCTIIARDPSIKFDRKEKWMGAEYTVFPIGDLPAVSAPPAGLAISYPAPNKFVPDDLRLLNATGACTTAGVRRDPVQLVNDDGVTLLHYPDDEFLVPESSYIFQIKTPSVRPGDARALCLLSLYLRFVEERLTEISYDASSSGLHYNVWAHLNVGVGFSVEGYSQKAVELLRSVIEYLRNPRFNQAEFDIFRESLARGYRNTTRNQPIHQASERFSYLIYDKSCLSRDLAHAAESITLEELEAFASTLFARRRIEAFVGGNTSSTDALNTLQLVREQLPGTACSKEEVARAKVKGFDDKVDSVDSDAAVVVPRMHSFDVDVKGNAVFWGIGLGTRTDASRAGQHLLSKLIQEPFYSELRTKQQTGYMVSSSHFQADKRLFFNASVQSNAYDPRDLLSRIDLFMETFLRNVSGDDTGIPSRFESIRDASVRRLRQPFNSLSAKLHHLNHIAFEEDGDYGIRDRRIHALETYTLDDLRRFAETSLSRENRRKLAVLAYGNSLEVDSAPYMPVDVSGSVLASRRSSKL